MRSIYPSSEKTLMEIVRAQRCDFTHMFYWKVSELCGKKLPRANHLAMAVGETR